MGSEKTQNLQKQLNNVNMTEWSPVQSIIMQVINKFTWLQSRSLIC